MREKAAVIQREHYPKKMQQHKNCEGTARCPLRLHLSSPVRVNSAYVLSYSETSPGEIALGLWEASEACFLSGNLLFHLVSGFLDSSNFSRKKKKSHFINISASYLIEVSNI